MGAPRGDDTDDFDLWARACADQVAELIRDGIPEGLRPELEGAGQAITTAPGYQSRFVGLRPPQFGKLSLWIYVVPAGHAYSSRRDLPQLGTGVMRGPQVNLAESEGRWKFRSGNPFRWQTLLGGWEGYLMLESLSPSDVPADVAARFAPRVLLGLDRAGLIDRS